MPICLTSNIAPSICRLRKNEWSPACLTQSTHSSVFTEACLFTASARVTWFIDRDGTIFNTQRYGCYDTVVIYSFPIPEENPAVRPGASAAPSKRSSSRNLLAEGENQQIPKPIPRVGQPASRWCAYRSDTAATPQSLLPPG